MSVIDLNQHARAEPAAAGALPAADLSFYHARRFVPATLNNPHFYLIGCGGNGSWVAPNLARLARDLKRGGKRVRLTFIDYDRVELKNVIRQNFCEAEVGEYKAVTLAERFGEAYGLEIEAVTDAFTAKDLDASHAGISVMIGCVDGPDPRKEMAKALGSYGANHSTQRATVWLDCGNHKNAGQVIIGNTVNASYLAEGFPLPKVCTALPAPSLVMPDLLEHDKKKVEPRPDASCAELAAANEQSPTINWMIAGFASQFLYSLFLYGELKTFYVYHDTRSSNTTQKYITPEAVSAVSGVPVEQLTRAQAKRPLAA